MYLPCSEFFSWSHPDARRRHVGLYRAIISNIALFLVLILPSVSKAQDLTWVEQLPVIELTYDEAQFNPSTYVPATITYHSVDSARQYSCTIRHRGGSSLVFDKPNYALKFYDAQGESLDVSFLDMRTDNHWILDAAAGDQSKMRNRASMDLWLDFSHKPYHQEQEPKAINGNRGHFVEVYANGEFEGLYCFSEYIDRKQLKLKKFKVDSETGEPYYRGLLYKALYSDGRRTPFFYYNSQKPESDAVWEWDGMKCEYPDVKDGEPWSWDPLLLSVRKVAFSSSQFTKLMTEYFDLPVFYDYMLFVDLMCAPDNVGKNYYCWFYDYTSGDTRLGYTPWDMDATWGRNWAGESVSTDQPMNNRSNFHTRMKESFEGYADILAARYAELRRSFWTEESLFSYFDRYFQLFEETGAIDREMQRWEGSNCRVNSVADEKAFIHEWIHGRLLYMDEEYGFDPAGITQVRQDAEAPVARYDLYGRPVSGQASGFSVQSGAIRLLRP